ncbi:MAG TPA: DUF6529 family protein [Ktedonobacterales bacterium]
MSEQIRMDGKAPLGPAWLAVPFSIFAVVSLTIGLVASRTVQRPYAAPYFSLFFSDTLHMKVWLTTAAMALGFFQLLTAARIYDLLRFPPPGRFYRIVHRWSGRTAIALTVPVAYHCIFLLGFGTYDPRVYIHSAVACTLYGAFLTKVVFVRSGRYPRWAIPIAGGLLFTILLGIWLTSALWFFGTPSYPDHTFAL